MSELISRKSVLDKIEKSLLIDELTVGEKAVLSDVATMISLEPTVDTRTPMDNIVEKLEEREKYLENVMRESHENGHRFSEEKAMNERVTIRYAINIVKQEINNGLE